MMSSVTAKAAEVLSEIMVMAPAKTAGGGIHLSSQLLLIVGIIVAIGVLAIIGWREGGSRATRAAREAEQNREIDE